jgi:predicted molibdopterin-dependent oxidoreductase YjgC
MISVTVDGVIRDAQKDELLIDLINRTGSRLTSSHTDPATHTPAYKETSVLLNVLPEVGERPLPRVNSRFGHPTPQTESRLSASGIAPITILQEMA